MILFGLQSFRELGPSAREVGGDEKAWEVVGKLEFLFFELFYLFAYFIN